MKANAAESVLVNFVYCHPVGHAVEALQHCLGFRRADPSRRIGVVLKSNTAVDLAGLCPFIDEVYTVDVDVFAHVPRDWDWVLDDPRGRMDWQREIFPGLASYYDRAAQHFRAAREHLVVGAPRPAYQPGDRKSVV